MRRPAVLLMMVLTLGCTHVAPVTPATAEPRIPPAVAPASSDPLVAAHPEPAEMAMAKRYFLTVHALVRRQFDLSVTVSDPSLKAEVAIRLSPNGDATDIRLTKPSGNDLFDEAVRQAVKRALPLPAPPEHLRAQLADRGVVMLFVP